MLRTVCRHGVALAAVLLFSCSPALAQDQGGGIQGVVRDLSKAVLPGVVIEARSPSMPGVATAVSDAEGVYRFPSLRPGTYELSANLSGFTPVKLPGIIVRLGAEFRIDVVMEVAKLAETVHVTAESPVVDVRQSTALSTLNDEALALLPARGRNFNDVLTMNAGVQNVDSGVSIDGASGLENHYIVDGLKTTAVLTGSSAQPVRLDFVEEIQVKSSGYAAEHGASMGGVVNIITKSGGDQYHGFFGTYYYDPRFRWNGDYRAETRFSPVDNRTPEVFVSQTTAKTRSPDYEWLGDIGGPIVKQRYWFYLSNSSSYEPNERDVIFANALQNGPRHFTNYESNVRTGYTLTGALTSKIRARVTGQFENSKTRRSMPGSMEPDGFTSRANPATRFDLTGEDIPKTLTTANIDYVATSRFFFNSKIGYTVNDRHDVQGAFLPELRHTFGRSNIGLAGVPADLQFASGYTSTPLSNSGRVREKLTRLAWDLSGTYFGSWKGQHAIKAGFNAEWIGDDVFNGATAPNITLQWNTSYNTPDNRTVRGEFGYYSVTQNGSYGKVTGNDIGVFIQDTWQPNARLTINAGVRTERELIPSYNPDNPDLTFSFADKIAPRLGFAWDVKGDARWKAYGSYGAFFDIMKLRIARFHFGGEINKTFYYSLDTANWRSVTCRSAGPPETSGCPGTYYGFRDDRVPVNAAGENRLDPDMKPSRTKEYVIGLDHELNKRTSVGIRYVRKPLDRLVEDAGIAVITPTSFLFIYKICNPGYGVCENTMGSNRLPDGRGYPPQPPARRDYDAVEMRFARRLSANFFLNGSYTWSYLRGNNSGLGNEDINETTLPSLTSNFDTIFMAYDARGNAVFGRMPNDRPHVFKLQAGYTLPFGTSVAADYLVQSGELESTNITQRSRYTFINGRGDLGRVDTQSRIDVRLQHDFSFFGQKRVNVAMDVRNLFDQKAVIDIGHTPYRDGFTIPDGEYFATSGFDIGSFVARLRASANDPQGLNNARSNPFYLQAQEWQSRRTVQFSAKFRF